MKGKGVTQPNVIRPQKAGEYEIVSGTRPPESQRACQICRYVCNLVNNIDITQMVKDDANQREENFPEYEINGPLNNVPALSTRPPKKELDKALDV